MRKATSEESSILSMNDLQYGSRVLLLVYVLFVVEEVLVCDAWPLYIMLAAHYYRYTTSAVSQQFLSTQGCTTAVQLTFTLVLSRRNTECRSCTGALAYTVEEHAKLLHFIPTHTRWSLGHRPRIASLQPHVRGCDTSLRSHYHFEWA